MCHVAYIIHVHVAYIIRSDIGRDEERLETFELRRLKLS